jgi:hypothetical protein
MMEVSWDPPASPSAGSIAGYRIYYGMLALPTDMDQWHTVDIEPYTYVEIKGLNHTLPMPFESELDRQTTD